MAAIISEFDKARARHHLGYSQVEAVQTFSLGVPAALQTAFMSEGAFNLILPSGVAKFMELLKRLDEVEKKVYCGIDLADVDVIGEITVNKDRFKELGKYYRLAQQSVANMLGIVPNPFDNREWLQMCGLGGGINVSVIG